MNLDDKITLTRLELATCLLMFSIDVLDDYTNFTQDSKAAILRSCFEDQVKVVKQPGLMEHIQKQVENVISIYPELIK